MKKILLLLLCCALMLSTIACSQTQPETTEAPTDTTTEATIPVEETTEATEPEVTTVATEPEETEPEETTEATEPDLMEFVNPEGTRLSEEEIAPFRELVEFPGDRIYNLATASLFDRPEDINLDILFCGITPRYELTKAEEEFLMQTRFKEYLPAYVKATGGKHAKDTFCFEASVIDDVLQQYFGITLAEHNTESDMSAIYWEEANCYYVQRSDTEQGYAIVQAVYEREDGYYDIYYLSGDFGFMYDNSGIPLEKEELNDIVCYCLTMKATDDGYLIVSNTPVYLVK